jgi:hypothetical protein
MQKVILFRSDRDTEEEFDAASAFMPTFKYRTDIPPNSLVFGRYSVLPFYSELEKELATRGSRLINTHAQHCYIADIMSWYADIHEYTPKTYDYWADLDEGKWVVKGKTNSRKFHWNTMMYAEDRPALLDTIRRLYNDTLIREQGVVVREYVPLKKVGEGINGLPITKEWRCFFLGETLLSSGYYWASHPECHQGDLPEEGKQLAIKVAKIIAKKTNFFVLDVAEAESGDWLIIEVNDGQMSGLSDNNPDVLYYQLKER